MSERSIILNADNIKKKITRIAYEIAERNYDEKNLILLGIEKNGLKIATQLAEELDDILSLKVKVGEIKINKDNPVLLQIMIDPQTNTYPKIAFGKPITEMEPFAKPIEMEGT